MTGCYHISGGNFVECFKCEFRYNCILNEILSKLSELREEIEKIKSTQLPSD